MPQENRGRYKPEGWNTITPRIVARDAEQFVTFLVRVFNAEGTVQPEGPATVMIGDSRLLVSEVGVREATAAFLYVYVEDVDSTYARALAEGATSLEAPSIVSYGDRRAMLADPWGNVWQIATCMR